MENAISRKTCGFKTEVNRSERLASGFISTTRVDEVGDVVMPKGMVIDPYFAENRNVNFNHERRNMIGKNRNIEVRSTGVYANTYIGKHALGEDVMTMIEEGICKWHSIEWNPSSLIQGPPNAAEKSLYGEGCNNVFRSWTLTGYALTTIPCNLGAAIDGVKKIPEVELRPVWDHLETLFKAGKIHRSSAVAAGFPDSPKRKVWNIPAPVAKAAVVAASVIVPLSGMVWRK